MTSINDYFDYHKVNLKQIKNKIPKLSNVQVWANYAIVTKELALAEADAMDLLIEDNVYLGPLHGIPYGLKDLFDTKDIETRKKANDELNKIFYSGSKQIGKY